MHVPFYRCRPLSIVLPMGLAFAALSAGAATAKKNPTSKFYVADLEGEAQIGTNDRIDELNKKSVYNAEGTVVETKVNAVNAMVFSNGTGIFFDEDTRLEVKQFSQEPFVPNRIDADVEPSMSQTQAYIPHGTVGLCTSKLVAGSSMSYKTPLGGVNIRGGKVVIQAGNGVTKISLLEGDSSVSAGDAGLGGQTLQQGQQAVIRDGGPGQAPQIEIGPIPDQEKPGLDAKASQACTAKKTVYFDVRTSSKSDSSSETSTTSVTSDKGPAGSSPEASDSPSNSPVSAFDSPSANAPTAPSNTSAPSVNPTQQIVAIPVVPTNVPVQSSTSMANLTGH